uniref:Uncharacterized protein n=1 Tax=Arundo donax TaxID=35708 RepID=A0A0A9BM29_ARUDO
MHVASPLGAILLFLSYMVRDALTLQTQHPFLHASRLREPSPAGDRRWRLDNGK